jgi:aminomethyltransferase
VAERDRGIARRLVGLATPGRQVPRAECPVLRDGAVVGMVTSGNFSPMLEHGIALAFVPPDTITGDSLIVDVRGRSLDATVVDLPFWSH